MLSAIFCRKEGGVMTKKVNLEDVTLIRGVKEDAELIQDMKIRAFQPLYEVYEDHDTSPVNESFERMVQILQEENTDYLLIQWQTTVVGAVRVIEKNPGIFRISPIFILPEYQNKGIASATLELLFCKYPQAVVWRLDTILQEKGNCHLYEKVGFVRTGAKKEINEKMTLIKYEKVNVNVSDFLESDAEEVANLIIRNFKEVNVKDYEEKTIQELVKTHNADWVKNIASFAHMYVLRKDQVIVGCGSISSFWGSLDESILLTVFVLPEYHGMGIGRKTIKILESDELFTRASRVEIPASITAVDFYKKFGYVYKDGKHQLDGEGHFRLEKYK